MKILNNIQPSFYDELNIIKNSLEKITKELEKMNNE